MWKDGSGSPMMWEDSATLALLKRIPSGETCPEMKCQSNARLSYLAGTDTLATLILTVKQGCMTATLGEDPTAKSVWLSAEVSNLFLQSQRESNGSSLSKVSWMLGKWMQKDPNGNLSFEEWSQESPDRLVGHAYTLSGRDTVFQEKLEVKIDNGQIMYVANVKENSGPVSFRMVESTPISVTFENKAHDFPQIIRYESKGDSGLVASISGLKNGQFGRSEFPLKRVKP